MSKDKSIKCVVWDLDNTVWDGVLLEDSAVALRPGVVEALRGLDERGILHSVASKNDPATALAKLEELGLAEYFLYPQIHWSSKVGSLEAIAGSINIGLDTLAFIDDQPFEREEVGFSLPQVLCLDATEVGGLLDRPEMMPRFVTDESRLRRHMYQSDIARNRVEEEYAGPKEEFLATLGMRFRLARAEVADLQRAEELTVRTHQLNSTGYGYSYDDLAELRRSPCHRLLIASLDDKYGTYGKIGLALVEEDAEVWTIKLLLMSCRVMSRGVGTIMLHHVMRRAKEAGARLRAEFLTTERNRMMYVTFKFAGFKEIERNGDALLLENELAAVPPYPDFVELDVSD